MCRQLYDKLMWINAYLPTKDSLSKKISRNNWFFLAIVKKKANRLGDAKVDEVEIAFKGRGESLGPSKIFSGGMC